MDYTVRPGELVLVTGATGYVGGRLVPRLLTAGFRVRVLVRDPMRIVGRSWYPDVEVAVGDVLSLDPLVSSLEGVVAAYYLVHSMMDSRDFYECDLEAARKFARAAQQARLRRIIYLGGLGKEQAALSPHLRSRQMTGAALRESKIAVTEFRAAVVVGSGSLSFEMIRYLVERLPVMICPQWINTRTQPIAIRDLLNYMLQSLHVPESAGRIIEIGGRDVTTYAEMLMDYARIRNLRRYLIPVPFMTSRLSAWWIHWMTPIPASIAPPLIESMRNEAVASMDTARQLFPEIEPMDYATAVRLALLRLEQSTVETVWSDALSSSQLHGVPVFLGEEQGLNIERREAKVAAPPSVVFRVFASLGGRQGWLRWNWVWQIRGLIDRLVGGVGMRRGRRHPSDVRIGDAIDFWRVEQVIPDRLIRLHAEMKVPGVAWLQFEVIPLEAGRTRFVQTAFFAAHGLSGFLYWYALYPIHCVIFRDMVKAIAARAESVIPDRHA